MGLINLDFRRFGWQFVFLNAVRVCNVIVLATITIAAVLLIIAAKFPNPWIVFEDIFLVFHMLFCFFLFLTEYRIGLWVSLEINMPAFGRESGLTGLGCSMMVLASSILGKLSDDRFASDKIGPVFWNTCAAAGILGYIFGFTNALSSWLLGSRQGRNIRKFRSTGEVVPSPALPEHTQDTRGYYGEDKSYMSSNPTSRVQSPAPSYKMGGPRAPLSRASSQRSQGQQHGGMYPPKQQINYG
ncbi:hypothetical protein KJ359_000873 [Pestalotiopsis sp. 9143b]|nr:hypothetical protein KJ359_000873 [Pestalotiopsis sp. 9143b]